MGAPCGHFSLKLPPRLRRLPPRLPPQQRAVFLLRFAEEMSLDEIARTLGLRVGSVKSHLFRALGTVKAHAGRTPGGKPGG